MIEFRIRISYFRSLNHSTLAAMNFSCDTEHHITVPNTANLRWWRPYDICPCYHRHSVAVAAGDGDDGGDGVVVVVDVVGDGDPSTPLVVNRITFPRTPDHPPLPQSLLLIDRMWVSHTALAAPLD